MWGFQSQAGHMQVWEAEFPARALPREMQMTDFLFWYYRGGSCSVENSIWYEVQMTFKINYHCKTGNNSDLAVHWVGISRLPECICCERLLSGAKIFFYVWMITVSQNIEKYRGYGGAEPPSRARPRRIQKAENLLLYYGVDLALWKCCYLCLGWTNKTYGMPSLSFYFRQFDILSL